MTVEEWKRKNPPIRRKPLTNADRIRQMTDEELAEFITSRQGLTHHHQHYEGTKLLWLDWLKEEVDDNES